MEALRGQGGGACLAPQAAQGGGGSLPTWAAVGVFWASPFFPFLGDARGACRVEEVVGWRPWVAGKQAPPSPGWTGGWRQSPYLWCRGTLYRGGLPLTRSLHSP